MSNAVYPERIHGLTFTVTKTPSFNTTKSVASSGASVRVQNYVNPIWKWQLIYEYLYDEFDSPNNTYPYGYSDLQTLMGFFLARSGQFDDFLFNDPSDNTVTDQPQPLITDGDGNWYTPLQRTMGGQFAEDITDLQAWTGVYLNGTPIPPSLNWTLKGPGLAIPGYSYRGIYVSWLPWLADYSYSLGTYLIDPDGHLQEVTTAGTSGDDAPDWNDSGGTSPDGDGSLVWTDQGLITSATATFQFYFRVQFGSDEEDFEQFMQELWTIGGESSKNGKGVLDLVTSRLPLTSSGTPGTLGTPPYIPSSALMPPPGQLYVILFPYQYSPTDPSIATNGLGICGTAAAFANGSVCGIALQRGPVTGLEGPFSVGASVSQYQLPASIDPASITKVMTVVYGTKTDGPASFPPPPYSNPFSNTQIPPAAWAGDVTGADGHDAGVNMPGTSGAGSAFVADAAVDTIAPGIYPTDAVPYESLAFTATLGQSSNGWLLSFFSGGMVVVVWYTP